MNKSMLTGLIIGTAVATAGGVIANFGYFTKNEPEYAQVIKVEETTRTVQTPREVCEDVTVTRQQPVKDNNRLLGTVSGALLGGVLGNQVGEGGGKKIATLAGAVAGGYAGNKVQQNVQAKNTYTTTEQRCHTVNDSHEIFEGYEVSYRLGDKEGKVHMDHRPGDRIPTENGQLALSEPVNVTQ
jgi:uncharacterized protein YcfJ